MSARRSVDDVRAIVRDVLERELGVEREKLLLDSRIHEDLGADSLDTAILVIELEDALGIALNDDDVLGKPLTVGKLCYLCGAA